MIYLDNAATTFKKPRSVIRAVDECLKKYCANAGRGSHSLAIKTSEMIYEARERISLHLGCNCAEKVIFFQNATAALNFAIKTSINYGDHIIISDVEHNAVFRPVNLLAARGVITYSVFDSSGDVVSNIEKLITAKTRCIASTLHSNVFGREISPSLLIELSNKYGLSLVMDASQYTGHKRIDISGANDALLCAPGHKALFGIQGSGFCVMTGSKKRETQLEGGSGNESKNPFMPNEPPERYEAGTLSAPSIVSLLKGLEFVEKITPEVIIHKIDDLSNYAVDCLSSFNGVKIYDNGGGIVSFNYKDISSEAVSYELGRMGICTRGGFHCAPTAHRTLGTYDVGTVRLSFSYFNKRADVSGIYKALKELQRIY